MFDKLTQKVADSLDSLRGQGRLTQSNIDATVRKIRQSLLEADTNFKVARDFVERVKQKSLGQNILKNMDAGVQFTKIVHDEMVQLLGGGADHGAGLSFKNARPGALLLAGLQGVGKTTTAAKLGVWFKKQNKKVGLVPLDLKRPAAIKQLKVLGQQTQTPTFNTDSSMDWQELQLQVCAWAKDTRLDILVLDTAGRLAVDEELMHELKHVHKLFNPQESVLVLDAMLGQQSVEVAKSFNEAVPLSALVLSKVDGDARAGAALSVRAQLPQVPIKFLGTGEKPQDLEVFYPKRLAGRILGMGDVVGLAERAKEAMDAKEAKAQMRKLQKGSFSFDDLIKQMRMLKKMGGMASMLKMLPGGHKLMGQLPSPKSLQQEMRRMEAIVNSMTLGERSGSVKLNGSRRLRIAKGSGTKVQDINKMTRGLEQTQKIMKSITL